MKRNKTKRNKTKRNEMDRNGTERNEAERNGEDTVSNSYTQPARKKMWGIDLSRKIEKTATSNVYIKRNTCDKCASLHAFPRPAES